MDKETQEKNAIAILEAGEIRTVDKHGNQVILTQDTGKAVYKLMCSIFGRRGGWQKGRKRK